MFRAITAVLSFLFIYPCHCQQTEIKGWPFSWLEKIAEAKAGLEKIEVKHSKNLQTYVQTRKLPPSAVRKKKNKRSRAIIRTVSVKRTDYAWKEAALALVNEKTGKLRFVKIRKEGRELLNDSHEFNIQIEKRVSGLTWNGRNTAFYIADPPGWAVIADKWIEAVNNKPKEFLFIPYSTKIHVDELIEAGDSHLQADIDSAFRQLKVLGVKSLVSPKRNIVALVSREYPKNIALVEHTDPQEFYAFLAGTLEFDPFDRVKVIIGANGDEAFLSFNYAGAIGLTQFTNNGSKILRRTGTWDIMRRAYPKANLPEFLAGATNHVESIKAAVLLYDYNLNVLVKNLGRQILEDEDLDYYLYAAHNCGIGRVIQAIKRPGHDWRAVLRKISNTDETNIFLEKIDYVVEK